MKIEGVLPHGGPLALDRDGFRPTAPASLTHAETWNDARPAHPENASRGRLPLRGTLSVLHHRALQNLSVTRANLSPPGVASTDSQLATALEKDFGRLHPFLNEGRLTWSSLRRVAAERTGQHEELDRTIQVVSEILKRPRLNDAILSRDGDIIRDSLRAAAQALQGNSSPSVFSQDPFHAQSNTQVVQALQGHFEQLRDKSQDRTFLFEQHQYVEIATLKAVMQDPYAVDPQGIASAGSVHRHAQAQVQRALRLHRKEHSERPGLLPSLERANGTRLFGPPHKGRLAQQQKSRSLAGTGRSSQGALMRLHLENFAAQGHTRKQQCDQHEGAAQAAAMRDETDHGRTGKNSGIPQGSDGGHGDVLWHHCLFTDGGIQHRYDIRTPGAYQCVAQQSGFPGWKQRRQQHAGGGQCAPDHDHPRSAQAPYDGITRQTAGGHGQGERCVTQASVGFVKSAFGTEEHRAPVKHGAFGQKHDKAQTADKQHHAVGNSKCRARTFTAVGQQMRTGLEQRHQP